MNRRKMSSLFLWLFLSLFLCLSAPVYAQNWGTIMEVQNKTKIRSDRSMKARIAGELKAGEKIRADFLKNEWYAVFDLNEKNRDESRARGYIHALNLSVPTALPATGEAVAVKSLTFKKERDGHERVLIEFSRFNTPKIFSIEGKNPRIVIDIDNVLSVRKGLSKVSADGKLVKQIRSALDRKTNSMRIVIDVGENRNYEVDQTYYKTENIYAIDISEEIKKTADTKSKTTKP
jgi:hypothetical protein